MTPQDEASIHIWHQSLNAEVELTTLFANDPQSDALRKFCEDFSRIAPRVGLRKADPEADDLPGIQINPRLVYNAVPAGPELKPFLEAIKAPLINDPALSPGQTITLTTDLPASLKLFIAPQCPFCPTVVRQALPLVMAGENLRMAIIDSFLFSAYAQQQNVQSVPTLLLDDHYRWTGTLPLPEIIHLINNRDPAQLGADSLRNLLQQGRAVQLATMMITHGSIFPALYELLTHPKWPIRLGAMVIIETLCDQDPALAQQVVDPLQKKFSGVDNTTQGDILHTIGQAGDYAVIPWLEAIGPKSDNPEIKEAAHEAVLAIRSRSVKV